MIKHMSKNTVNVKPGHVVHIEPTGNISDNQQSGFKKPEIIEFDYSVESKFRKMIKERINKVK